MTLLISLRPDLTQQGRSNPHLLADPDLKPAGDRLTHIRNPWLNPDTAALVAMHLCHMLLQIRLARE
jgi:hypothetical protein